MLNEGQPTEENESVSMDNTGSDNKEASAEASKKESSGSMLPVVRDVTRARALDLKSLFSKYLRRHLPETGTNQATMPAPPRITGSYAQLLPILRLVPWFLGAVFILSFFWDFPGGEITLLGNTLPVEGLLGIVSVSGMIGFLTNWLAITMLFNPRKRRPLLGHGLIPAQRDRVIYRMATTISEELINADIIKQKIEESGIIPKYREMAISVTKSVLDDPEFRDELKGIVSSYVQQVVGSEDMRDKIVDYVVLKVEEYLGSGIGGLALKAYRMLNEEDFQRRIEEAVTRLPSAIDEVIGRTENILDIIPDKIEERSQDIEDAASRMITSFVENLDIYEMIAGNMQQYDEKRLEDMLKRATNEQLNYIKYLGVVLGCIGGFVIWQPIPSLIVLGLIGSVIYGLDVVLFRMKNANESVVT
ncbi:MAG: DUF445 domain-containing protein [Rhodothermaceae bacterium]|nr:DUF445 domain-containing protein [Rhodothermaceae bacterium]